MWIAQRVMQRLIHLVYVDDAKHSPPDGMRNDLTPLASSRNTPDCVPVRTYTPTILDDTCEAFHEFRIKIINGSVGCTL